MLVLFSLHFLKNLRRCRVIDFQSSSEVCVNAGIGFLQRNCQRENFLFRQVFEIFCQGTSSRYELRMRTLFFPTAGVGEADGVSCSEAPAATSYYGGV